MKIEILKRIRKAEEKVFKGSVPELIMIHYNPLKEKYVVKEQSKTKSKELFFKHYKDYIFNPEYKGQVIIDMTEDPVNQTDGALYTFNMKTLKADNKIPSNCAVSLEVQNEERTVLVVTCLDFSL